MVSVSRAGVVAYVLPPPRRMFGTKHARLPIGKVPLDERAMVGAMGVTGRIRPEMRTARARCRHDYHPRLLKGGHDSTQPVLGSPQFLLAQRTKVRPKRFRHRFDPDERFLPLLSQLERARAPVIGMDRTPDKPLLDERTHDAHGGRVTNPEYARQMTDCRHIGAGCGNKAQRRSLGGRKSRSAPGLLECTPDALERPNDPVDGLVTLHCLT